MSEKRKLGGKSKRFIQRVPFRSVKSKTKTRVLSTEEQKKEFKAVIRSSNFPAYFNWADYKNVIRERFNGVPPPHLSHFILPPIDQGQCGNCYAVSSANMTAYRWAIWSLNSPFRFSWNEMTDCTAIIKDAISQGCNGGNPADCAAYLFKYGADDEFTYDSIVKKLGHKNGRVSTDTGNAPPIKSLPKMCWTRSGYKITGIDDVAVQIGSIEGIKYELFNNGPVVGMFKVWDDFNYPTNTDQHIWPETNNIYIRGAYRNRSKKFARIDSSPSPSSFDTPQLSILSDVDPIHAFFERYALGVNVNFTAEEIDTYKKNFEENTGIPWATYWFNADQRVDSKVVADDDPDVVGHAVVIVGWGKDNNVPGYGPLEYWIVQNSWGDDWNDIGYFKIAMSQQKGPDGVYAPVKDPGRPEPVPLSQTHPGDPEKYHHINEYVGIDLLTPDGYGGTFTWKPCIKDKSGKCLEMPRMPQDIQDLTPSSSSDNDGISPTPSSNDDTFPILPFFTAPDELPGTLVSKLNNKQPSKPASTKTTTAQSPPTDSEITPAPAPAPEPLLPNIPPGPIPIPDQPSYIPMTILEHENPNEKMPTWLIIIFGSLGLIFIVLVCLFLYEKFSRGFVKPLSTPLKFSSNNNNNNTPSIIPQYNIPVSSVPIASLPPISSTLLSSPPPPPSMNIS